MGIVSREGKIRRNLCVILGFFLLNVWVFFWFNEEIMGKEQKDEVIW